MYIFSTLLVLAFALPAPAQPLAHTIAVRQGNDTDSKIAEAFAKLFGGLFAAFHSSTSGGSGSSATSAASTAGTTSGTSVAFTNCAAASSVSSVFIVPCEGGTGAEGDACVFTQGK